MNRLILGIDPGTTESGICVIVGSQLPEFDRELPQFGRKSGWRQEYRNESEAGQ